MQRNIIRSFVAASIACLGLTSVAVASGTGNSASAQQCQRNGYLHLARSDGTTFRNAGECVGYTAQGGALQQVSVYDVCVTNGGFFEVGGTIGVLGRPVEYGCVSLPTEAAFSAVGLVYSSACLSSGWYVYEKASDPWAVECYVTSS